MSNTPPNPPNPPNPPGPLAKQSDIGEHGQKECEQFTIDAFLYLIHGGICAAVSRDVRAAHTVWINIRSGHGMIVTTSRYSLIFHLKIGETPDLANTKADIPILGIPVVLAAIPPLNERTPSEHNAVWEILGSLIFQCSVLLDHVNNRADEDIPGDTRPMVSEHSPGTFRLRPGSACAARAAALEAEFYWHLVHDNGWTPSPRATLLLDKFPCGLDSVKDLLYERITVMPNRGTEAEA